jgi:sugar (pentulose or hexulose) kinase
MLGRLGDDGLALREIHRFSSQPVRLPGGLFSDVARIWEGIVTGLGHALGAEGVGIDAVSVDTWGVDFALLDGESGLLGLPHHYRDELWVGMAERAYQLVAMEDVFRRTGNQLMPINSLYQLLGLAHRRPSYLAAAQELLFLPDLFTHWLGGGQKDGSGHRFHLAVLRSGGKRLGFFAARAARSPPASVRSAPRRWLGGR